MPLGDAARVWTDADDSGELRANLEALPGFGEMKVKSMGAVLAKLYGVKAAKALVPPHPTLGDPASPPGLRHQGQAMRNVAVTRGLMQT